MKIDILIENTAYSPAFVTEHGLSLHINIGTHRILFDAGQSNAFAQNAQQMGIDLTQVDMAILSHGHYDHSGGLRWFLQHNQKAPLYLNRYALEPHLHGTERDISVNPTLKDNPRLIFTDNITPLGDRMELRTCNGCTSLYPASSKGMNTVTNGQIMQDNFRHEQYLIIEQDGKRIVFSGCSHKGVLNIVHWLKPDVLIGGFHFMNLDPNGPDREILDQAAQALLQFPTQYYTCHCTGPAASEYLKARMGDRLQLLQCGQSFSL